MLKIEQNKDTSNLVFNNEINSLEFVQIIGDMDIIHLKDYKKRDLFLKKYGKKLFRKFKKKKPRKLSIKIRRETRILADEEIDSLLINADGQIKLIDKIKRNIKMFYGNCSEWKIIFSKNNIAYKFSLNGIKKIDYNKKPIEHEKIIGTHTKFLSPEEIDRILTPIGFTLPESCTSFIPSEFKDFTEIVKINVDKENSVFCSVDGVLFDKAMSRLIKYPINKNKTNYTIPDGVISISKFAFYGCKRLVNIVFPESLKIIQNYAFAYCMGFKTIILPMKLLFIGEGAFENCLNLETVTLSRKTRIGHKAFEGVKGKLIYRD